LLPEMWHLWATITHVLEHGNPKCISEAWADTKFTQFLLRMYRDIVSNWRHFESISTTVSKIWMYPVCIWGYIVGTEEQQRIVTSHKSLLSHEVFALLEQILSLISSSTTLQMNGMNSIGLHKTLQALSNFVHHSAAWLSNDLRLALCNNRLIKEFNTLVTSTGPGGTWRCMPAKHFPDLDNNRVPPLRVIRSTGTYLCMKCHGSTFSPVMCRKCGKVPYCSLKCQQDHLPIHRAICRLEDPVGEGSEEAVATNAPLSDVILRSRPSPPSIYLLEFSRSPESFRLCLLDRPKLVECHTSLREKGFDPDLPSGAKVFVNPNQFQPLMHALDTESWELKPRHVLVSDDFEEEVLAAVESLRSNDRVKQKQRSTVIGMAEASNGTETFGQDLQAPANMRTGASEESAETVQSSHESMGGPAESSGDNRRADINLDLYLVKRTFIHIPIPSSLWSGPTSGQKTASTTDADPRFGQNPRVATRSSTSRTEQSS